VAGLVSEAEHEIRRLNDEGGPVLDPLARLLLRTESIASSKIERLQLGARELARAEARAESGITPSPNAMEILANIDARSESPRDSTDGRRRSTARRFGHPRERRRASRCGALRPDAPDSRDVPADSSP
jgi:hypothetical protein